jgi:hypothetical protein
MPPGCEEKKSKTGPNRGPRQHFRQLCLFVHTNLLLRPAARDVRARKLPLRRPAVPG